MSCGATEYQINFCSQHAKCLKRTLKFALRHSADPTTVCAVRTATARLGDGSNSRRAFFFLLECVSSGTQWQNESLEIWFITYELNKASCVLPVLYQYILSQMYSCEIFAATTFDENNHNKTIWGNIVLSKFKMKMTTRHILLLVFI